MEKIVYGKCPKCGHDVVKGKYGFYCEGKCGLTLGRAYGANLSDEEMTAILNGERLLLRGLKGKSGNSYNAYLKANRVEPYSYTNKDGEQKTGFQIKYEMTFPSREEEEQEV